MKITNIKEILKLLSAQYFVMGTIKNSEYNEKFINDSLMDFVRYIRSKKISCDIHYVNNNEIEPISYNQALEDLAKELEK